MDGDTTAATTAKKKQLEAELIEAQKALEETYYDHSMNARQDALDKEFSDFEEEKNAEIEKWEEWLKDTENVVSESLSYVKENTTLVYNELSALGSQYGLTLSDTLTTPWTTGQMAIDDYSVSFETAVSSFTEMLDGIVLHWQDVTTAAEAAARAQASALQAQYNKTASQAASGGGNYTPQKQPTQNTPQPAAPTPQPAKPAQPSLSKGSSVKVKKTATHFTRDAGDGTKMQSWVPGSTFTVMGVSGNEVLIGRNGGYTGWVKKTDLEGFARGTKYNNKNQWAIIDELGEELVINADGNGRLSYLTKGSGVVPADLTENLMDLALDPASAIEGMLPKTKIPVINNNNMSVDMHIDKVVNIEHADNTTIPEIKRAVNSQMEAYMKQLNNGLKRAGKS